MRKYVKKMTDLFVAAVCRLRQRRGRTKLLFYGNNVMNYTMFKPIYQKIEELSKTDVFFCFDMPGQDYSGFIRLGVPEKRIVSLTRARLNIWDAIICADFRKPRYLWTGKFVYLCHGVAAKKCSFVGETGEQTVGDYRYHHSMKHYDLVFFHNEADYQNAKQKGLFKHPDSGHVVGMCCLDEVVRTNGSRQMLLTLKKKFIPPQFQGRKVILYAPTWSDSTSFTRKGREILSALATSDAFVIVKPHPLCITSEVGQSGYDLKSFLQVHFKQGNYLLVTDTPYEIMPITDMIIADFSSITFEYALLHKPIFLFESRDIEDTVADKKQYEMLRQCSFIFRETDEIREETFRIPRLEADKLIGMEKLQKKYFANPGSATEVAVRKLIEYGIVIAKEPPLIKKSKLAGA